MRIVVMGTGGVGGYFGARLASAGHEVIFVARGKHLKAIRDNGLFIESPRGDLHLQDVKVVETPEQAEAADIVLLGVKLWDTDAAADLIRPLTESGAAVISIQNGVVKDEILSERLGSSSVIGGVCYIASEIVAPGHIRHSGTMQKLVFGEYDGSVSPRVTQFRDACVDAGIDIEISPDIRLTIWDKFVFLVGLSGTTGLARVPIGPIRTNPRSRAFLHDVMDEVVQVGRAEGVALSEDYAMGRLDFCDQIPATMTSSMHNDLERGNRLEVRWLSGDVVMRGGRAGIPTPCNRAVFDILSVHSEGRP
ncbi:MAG: 2-dehydropantoate 2-reductase [Burkholderiales bacterium]